MFSPFVATTPLTMDDDDAMAYLMSLTSDPAQWSITSVDSSDPEVECWLFQYEPEWVRVYVTQAEVAAS